MTELYICLAYLSSGYFKKSGFLPFSCNRRLISFQFALVVCLAPATPDAPGAGEVLAQHAAALPASRLVVRNERRNRKSFFGVIDRVPIDFRFFRVLDPICAGIRYIRYIRYIRLLEPVPARRNSGTFVVSPVSAQRAVPVGTIAGYEKHGPAAALGIVGDCHEKSLSPSSGRHKPCRNIRILHG